ncbi:hypothetical protein HS041_31025 [Planomonospora sp. ID67723]|uniref:hypothetical protein n=1 Tax=Planomonospora sp. ID67723 TaxID=2738134 RepID=UPI0018C3800D|nr:hypothetical protein [Planomonospora sp. ID67723]MBG0832142.1 hypothetical protein [Planomonospora sp. ID67723]
MRTAKIAAMAGAVALLALGAGQAAGAATGLPDGFLLYEAEAEGPREPWETWQVSDSLSRPLALNPCHVKRPWDGGRSQARSVRYAAETELRHEQVVVYRSERAARAAMTGLRAQLKRCAKVGGKLGRDYDAYTYRWKGTGIGDESVRAGARYFESAFRHVAVRRGKAVVVYAEDGSFTSKLKAGHFRGLERDARKMAAKVCELPGVC